MKSNTWKAEAVCQEAAGPLACLPLPLPSRPSTRSQSVQTISLGHTDKEKSVDAAGPSRRKPASLPGKLITDRRTAQSCHLLAVGPGRPRSSMTES